MVITKDEYKTSNKIPAVDTNPIGKVSTPGPSLERKLFKVDGDLVDNYNRSLEKITGKKTALKSFYVDKRGESPELELEFGQHYLQHGPAHRFMIVVSPEQQNANLINQEFSFDNAIIDQVYLQHPTELAVVTKVDSLFAELDDGISAYQSLDDLLMVKGIDVELHTPSGFLTAAKELKDKVQQLKADPELLTKNDSSAVKEIYALAQEIGDVRSFNIDKMFIHHDAESFSSSLFNGLYVFREPKQKTTRKLKRPSRSIREEGKSALSFIIQQHQDIAYDELGKAETTVIYFKNGINPESGPKVDYVPLQDSPRVLKFLTSKGYIAYNVEKLPQLMERLEDLDILKVGYVPTNLDNTERSMALHKLSKENRSASWNALRKMQVSMTKGYTFDELVESLPIDMKVGLIDVTVEDETLNNVVSNLLTNYVNYDFESLNKWNKSKLQSLFDNSDVNTKQYIVDVLKGK